jgi:type IV pilus assembly protein PilQ
MSKLSFYHKVNLRDSKPLRLVLLFVSIVLTQPPALAVSHSSNRIQAINVQADGQERSVTIRTSHEPIFTVFRLSDPSRVVVDISGAKLEQFHTPDFIDDNLIVSIATHQFDSGTSSVSRVTIALEKDLAYRVQTQTQGLILKLGDSGLGTIQRAPPPPVAPADRAAAERYEKSKSEAQKAARVAQEERHKAIQAAHEAEKKIAESKAASYKVKKAYDDIQKAKATVLELSRETKITAARERREVAQSLKEAENYLAKLKLNADELTRARQKAELLAQHARQSKAQHDADAAKAQMEHRQTRLQMQELKTKLSRDAQSLAQAQGELAKERQELEGARAAYTNQRSQLAQLKSSIEKEKALAKSEYQNVRKIKRQVQESKKQNKSELEKLTKLEERLRLDQEHIQNEKRDMLRQKKMAEKIQQRQANEGVKLKQLRTHLENKKGLLVASQQELAQRQLIQKKQVASLAKQRHSLSQEQESLANERQEIEKARVTVTKRGEKARVDFSRTQEERKTIVHLRKVLVQERKLAKQSRLGSEKALQKAHRISASQQRKMTEIAKLRESLVVDRKTAILEREALESARQKNSQLQQAHEQEWLKLDRLKTQLSQDKNLLEKERQQAKNEVEQTRLALNHQQIELRNRREELAHRQKELRAKEKDIEFKVKDIQTAAATSSNVESPTQGPPARLSGVQSRPDGTIVLMLQGEASYKTKMIESPPRLVVDLNNTRRSLRKRHFKIEHDPVHQIRLGRHGKNLRAVLDLENGHGTHRVRRIEDGIEISWQKHRFRTQKAKAVPLASGLSAQGGLDQKSHSGSAKMSAVSKKTPISFRNIDFKSKGRVSTLVVELSGAVKPQLDTRSPRSWVMKIPGARIESAKEKTIDTASFGNAVRLVSVYQANPTNVNVVVNLSGSAKSHLKKEKGRLVWEITTLEKAPLIQTSAPRAAGFAGTAATLAKKQVTQSLKKKRRITVDLKDAEVINVLRFIADVSGENIIASDDVKGRITLRLRNVPWDTALETILRTKGFDSVKKDNILRVAPAAVIQKERDREISRKKAQEQVEEMVIRIISVNYAEASNMAVQVKALLSSRGNVQVDSRTNALIVEDIRSNIGRSIDLVRSLDRQTPQVLIEARIVEASTTASQEFGIQWGGSSQQTSRTGNPTGLAFPSDFSVSGAADDGATPTAGNSATPRYAVNLPAAIGAGSGGGLGFVFGSAGSTDLLNLRLSALESTGQARIISSPRVTTLDNKTATINSGREIPFQTTSAEGTTTTFKKADLLLEVTPRVTNDGGVILKITTNKSEPDAAFSANDGSPSIASKKATTEVLVQDGDTTVIGGIYTKSTAKSSSGLPFLSNLPFIGALFRNSSSNERREELLIFVTPRIVNRKQALLGTRSIGSGPSSPRN